jgi:prophage antirepressor-like protein
VNNELVKIEERELLGKEFRMYGDFENPLFLAKDVAEWIEITNVSQMLNKIDDEEKGIYNTYTLGGNQNLWFLTEDGLYEVLMQSRKPIAKQFKKEVKILLKEYRKHGKYDLKEQQLMQIEDEQEKTLRLTLNKLEEMLKITPNDLMITVMYNNKKNELNNYLLKKEQDRQCKKIDEIADIIGKTMIPREGDMMAVAVARKLNIYSLKNNPHNTLAITLAKYLGFYKNPINNAGYKDDYISINVATVGGEKIPTLFYSKLAFEKMKEVFVKGEYSLEKIIYTRGIKKGSFKEAILTIGEEHIKVNEQTYNELTNDLKYDNI